MVTKRKPSIYDGIESEIIRKFDDRLPFNCFNEKINWYEVLKWMNENLPAWTIDVEWKKDGE